ncbi:MAG TPA: hypothetical protein VHT96_14045 [Clostridia bacterium]|nr:hypothetical protein [Clostridia bacterium]
MNQASRKALKNLTIFLAICMIIASYLAISNAVIEPQAHISPNYTKTDILPILSKTALSGEDYNTLFFQTGLGKLAIDELRAQNPDSARYILRFQEYFFKDVRFVCENNSPISREESLVDEKGNTIYGTEFASLHSGDILVTKSSHTLGWRNGHSALVVDPVRGLTLESVVLGTNSAMQDVRKWINYPNFMLLRVKGITGYDLETIARSATERLCDIPYDLTVGIFSSKDAFGSAKTIREKITGTHCSHLVWLAFKNFGVDIDADGGILVTPKDIANSKKLEIVQVYGVNPGDIWP